MVAEQRFWSGSGQEFRIGRVYEWPKIESRDLVPGGVVIGVSVAKVK